MKKSFPILLVGSGLQTSLENMYLRAFASVGYDQVDLLDIESTRPTILRNRIVNRLIPAAGHTWAGKLLLNHLRDNKARYRLIIFFKGMQFSRQILNDARKMTSNCLWININPDDPYNLASRGASNFNVIESLSFFDAYCIWSHTIENMLLSDGCKRVIYLPFGYDTSFHVNQENIKQGINEQISFIGTWDKEREAFLSQLACYNINIYGNRWKRAAKKFPLQEKVTYTDVFGKEMISIMASSAICLNLLRPQNRGSHNMRTFEIPAMGGLMLTNRTEEQQEFFPENEACYMYGSMDELKGKIDCILANRQEADRVRARGMELVQSHSYTNRARYLLQELAG